MKYVVLVLLVLLLIGLLALSRWARMRSAGLPPDGSAHDSPDGPRSGT